MATAARWVRAELLYKDGGHEVRERRNRAMRVIVLVFVCVVGIVVICVGVWHLVGTHVHSVDITVHTDNLLHRVDDKFLSLALDSSTIRDGWVQKHIRSEKLLKLTAALAPAYLRVGGTQADRLVFQPEYEIKEKEPEEFIDTGFYAYEEKGFSPHNMSFFHMSGNDWQGLNDFTRNAQLHLLFDLNVLLRTGSRWNDSNAKLLLDYSDRLGYDVSWQLGNEPNAFEHVFETPVSATALGNDFNHLRQVLDVFPHYRKSILIGPDITHPKKRPKVQLNPTLYLRDFLQVANGSINAITWHQYYVNGRKAKLSDFVKPGVLDMLHWQISAIKSVASKLTLPIWLTETSSAYGGGAKDLSDRFVAGFMWLDKLGLAARMGISVVMRQSLCKGHYSLIDDNLEPNPDWWLSVLYKHLVGKGVLSVSNAPEHFRVYCHCGHEENTVVVFGMNLSTLPSQITISGLPSSLQVLAYVLTCDIILTSKHVLLNGKRLQLNSDDSLPPLEPVVSSLSEPLVVPPFSMVFWVIKNVYVPVCTIAS